MEGVTIEGVSLTDSTELIVTEECSIDEEEFIPGSSLYVVGFSENEFDGSVIEFISNGETFSASEYQLASIIESGKLVRGRNE